MKKINTKLTLVFLTLTIIPLIITVTVIMVAVDKGFIELSNTQQDEMIHLVQTEIDTVSQDLLMLTERYATSQDFVESLRANDRDTLAQQVAETYPRLLAEHGIAAFEFGDTNGIVVLRGHNPSEYGDDKSDIPAIQAALNGQALSGFEFGKSGLSVRAFVPITANSQIIGTLQTSINASFMKQLSEALPGVIISLYDSNGEMMFSSNEQSLPTLDATVLEEVQHGTIVELTENTYLQSILPMADPTGDELIGAIGITQDLSTIQQSKQQIIKIALVIFLITFIVVIILALFISRSISTPVIQASAIMRRLATGDLTVDIEERKSQDEIGQLAADMKTMKTNFYQAIEQVNAASVRVASQSNQLNQTSTEIQDGSNQIALTLEEISASSENQAQNIAVIASTMSEFTGTIQETNKKGQQIHTNSQSVLSLATEGTQAMDSSTKQMEKIQVIMQEAVSKMNQLDETAQEISSLVTIIQSIADQTNLLALNASIEAARAGEHGKGFAVVADEVRKLSEQVADSVTGITHLVSTVQQESLSMETSLKEGYEEVQSGVSRIQATGQTFSDITMSVTHMSDMIEQITVSLHNNVEHAQQMTSTIDNIVAISQETAAAIEETSATSLEFNNSVEDVAYSTKQLAELAEELRELVQHFKL